MGRGRGARLKGRGRQFHAHGSGRAPHDVGNAAAQHKGVNLLLRSGKTLRAASPLQVTMLRRFARAQEGKLGHQRDVVAEAGELGTLAAVLAVMKKGVLPRELSRLLAPKGGVPEMRVGRILARNQLACLHAMGENATRETIQLVGLANAVEQGALQGGQPVGVYLRTGGLGHVSAWYLACTAGRTTGWRKVHVKAKRRIDHVKEHLYSIGLKKIKLYDRGDNVLGNNVIDPNTVSKT